MNRINSVSSNHNMQGSHPAAVDHVSLKSSFFLNEFNNLDHFYTSVDHRINAKLAQTMKKAIMLIIEEVDLHLSNKMEVLVQNEVNKKIQFVFSALDPTKSDDLDSEKIKNNGLLEHN